MALIVFFDDTSTSSHSYKLPIFFSTAFEIFLLFFSLFFCSFDFSTPFLFLFLFRKSFPPEEENLPSSLPFQEERG
jgi:hypothetical protein